MAWKFSKSDGTKLGGGEKGWTFFAPSGIETGDGGCDTCPEDYPYLTDGDESFIFAAGEPILAFVM